MYYKSGDTNHVAMVGTVIEAPVWSYRYRDEHFYITHILVKRLSGASDILPVTIPGHLLVMVSALKGGDKIALKDQLRS